nr:MAG TPA: hypothetical protein [Bacteriophage sp.]
MPYIYCTIYKLFCALYLCIIPSCFVPYIVVSFNHSKEIAP